MAYSSGTETSDPYGVPELTPCFCLDSCCSIFSCFVDQCLSSCPFSFGHIVSVFRRFRTSGYLFGIFWLPLWYLLVTYLVSSGYLFGIFRLPLWYLLVTSLVASGYLFGIFWLLLWYLLVTSLVSSGYFLGIFWLPLW